MATDCKMRLKLILKIEEIMRWWAKDSGEPKYIHFARYLVVTDFKSNDESQNLGLIRIIKTAIASLNSNLD